MLISVSKRLQILLQGGAGICAEVPRNRCKSACRN